MSEPDTFGVLLIDDHPLFRKGVGQLLEMDDGFRLLGEAASGPQGLEQAQSLRPALILLDLNMKGMSGFETLTALKETDPEALVIVVTVSNAQDDVVAALRRGADGYLVKDMEPELLLAKLREAAKGEVVLDRTLSGMLARALREDTRTPPPTEANLTEREHEILRLIAEGMSNKKIARALDISDGTVKVHVKNLLRKLNLRSRLEAAVWALGHAQHD